MKELEWKALVDLINIYTELNNKGLNKNTQEKARLVYDEYHPGHTILSEIVNEIVGKLFLIGYPNIDPNVKIPSQKEIKKIIQKLNELKKELEK